MKISKKSVMKISSIIVGMVIVVGFRGARTPECGSLPCDRAMSSYKGAVRSRRGAGRRD